ncbi:MAG: RNA-binding protein [Clostridiales bacterium]|nr:RNA-binding protein [Clostridiales bacterium]
MGQIVHSKAGRDKEKCFIVVGIIDNEYVLIADGDLRKIEKPKKKKIKHVIIRDLVAEDIKNKFEYNVKVSNSDLKNSLKQLGLINGLNGKEV